MLSKLIDLLPRKISMLSIIVMFKYFLYRRRFWLWYYMKKFAITKNYYKTLSAINSNKFVPTGLNLQFIEEVGSI